MIVFDLSCDTGHRFEGWFASSADYADQCERGLLTCPQCGSAAVGKAPMAPAVPVKGNARTEASQTSGRDVPQQLANAPMPPEVAKAIKALAEAQAKALKSSTWVGDKFAEQARSMHYGEVEDAPIHGKATAEEAAELAAEGVPVAPILFPVAPPEDLN